MVNKEIVLETIRKMYDSEIDDSVVEATLRDIGLKDDEISSYIAEVKGQAPLKQPSQEEQHEQIAQKAAEKIKLHMNEEKEERELRETTQQADFDEQHRHLENVEQSVAGLHQKVESLATPANRELNDRLSVLESRINGLEKKLIDLKAISTSTKELMDKVLEVNRKILNKL